MKLSIGLWVFAGAADRFCPQGYTDPLSVEQQVKLASKVSGIEGIECHQSDFDKIEPKEFKKLLDDNNLECSNVNTNVWGYRKFKLGSLSSRDASIRQSAIQEGKRAIEYARQLEAPSIGLWLGSDGFDYPFQIEYQTHWNLLIEGIKELAEYAAPDIKIAIEYKLKEPRTHVSICDAGRALSICLELGLENVGVCVDFGHSLMSRESPAETVVILARHNKLFNVHFNDCYREWDDDLSVGTVHLWETLEFLYYCKVVGYDGWFALDQFPYREDPVEAAQFSVDNIKALWAKVEALPQAELQNMQATMNPIAAQKLVRRLFL